MHDDQANDLVAAGAVLMLLLVAQGHVRTLTSVDVVTSESGGPTNQLDITVTFLRSPYRLTVTRVQEDQ